MLTVRHPLTLRPLSRLGDIDRLFDGMMPTLPFDRASGWSPAMDVRESDDAFHVTLEAPGMAVDDIDISIEDSRLTISGEKRSVREDDNGRSFVAERRFGRFTRVLTLPKNVKAESIAASYEDGVLNVTVPKAPDARPRRIEVRRSTGKEVSGDS